MINFDIIKRDYPKAWYKFVTWNFINSSIYVQSPFDFLAQEFNWQKGILYDFFDENQIRGFVDYLNTKSGLDFYARIRIGTECEQTHILGIESGVIRKEMEAKMFIKCFEILESRLSEEEERRLIKILED